MRTVVLGGWGVSADILRSCCGEDAEYFDGTALAASCMDGELLQEDWVAKLAEAIGELDVLIGWSTGAMLALAAASVLKPRELVLLAPTLSFVRRPEHPHGMRSAVLAAMEAGLARDRGGVLAQFCSNAGVSPKWISAADEETLGGGLHFLAAADLRACTLPAATSCRLHLASYDAIVPPAASRFCAAYLQIDPCEHPGTHSFFCDLASFSL